MRLPHLCSCRTHLIIIYSYIYIYTVSPFWHRKPLQTWWCDLLRVHIQHLLEPKWKDLRPGGWKTKCVFSTQKNGCSINQSWRWRCGKECKCWWHLDTVCTCRQWVMKPVPLYEQHLRFVCVCVLEPLWLNCTWSQVILFISSCDF